MKTVLAVAAIVLLASGAYADPQYQQPQNQMSQGQEQNQHQSQGQSQNAISNAAASVKSDIKNTNTNLNSNVAVGGQGGKAVSGSIANAPTNVSPTQAVGPVTQKVEILPAPFLVQEAQRVIPNAVMSPQQTFIPSVQPAEPSGTATRGMPEMMSTIPGASVTLWKADGTSFDLKDIDGEVSSDVKIRYTPVSTKGAATRGKADRLTIYKEKPQGTRAVSRPSRTLGGLATVEATVPGMSYAELEVEIHKLAKAKGATAINVTAQGMRYKTSSKGWNVGAQLGVSAIGTLFGQNAVYGPMAQAMYQSLSANIEEIKFYDVELER